MNWDKYWSQIHNKDIGVYDVMSNTTEAIFNKRIALVERKPPPRQKAYKF